jgi:hypothetical protein
MKSITILCYGLCLIFLSSCSSLTSDESSNSFASPQESYKTIQESAVTVEDSYAWYNYMPIIEESENISLFVTSEIVLSNDASTLKTFTLEATITYNTVTYPVTLTLIDSETDEIWDGVLEASEITNLTAKIKNGPEDIQEDETIQLNFTITDSEENTLTLSTETTIIYTW